MRLSTCLEQLEQLLLLIASQLGALAGLMALGVQCCYATRMYAP